MSVNTEAALQLLLQRPDTRILIVCGRYLQAREHFEALKQAAKSHEKLLTINTCDMVVKYQPRGFVRVVSYESHADFRKIRGYRVDEVQYDSVPLPETRRFLDAYLTR